MATAPSLGDNFQFFRKMIDASPIAMIIVNQDGTIVFVNRFTEQLFGYSAHDLLKQNVEILVPERFRKAHAVSFASYMQLPKSRETSLGRDIFGLRIDFTEVPLELSLTPLRTENGFFVLASVVDISERKFVKDRLEQEADEKKQMADSQKQLEITNEQLAEFSHVVSHDLSDPLLKIESYLPAIEKELKSPFSAETQQALTVIKNSLAIGKKLIKDLLQYAQSSSIQVSTCNLQALVSDIVKITPFSNGISFKVDGLPTSIKVDATLIRQLFMNLIANAVKYQQPNRTNKTIEVKAEKDVFSIRDNGIGIAEKDLSKIFQPFFRVYPKDKYPGSGLGLSICKKIVEKHGGKIWIESKEGEGTTVSFTLGSSVSLQVV